MPSAISSAYEGGPSSRSRSLRGTIRRFVELSVCKDPAVEVEALDAAAGKARVDAQLLGLSEEGFENEGALPHTLLPGSRRPGNRGK